MGGPPPLPAMTRCDDETAGGAKRRLRPQGARVGEGGNGSERDGAGDKRIKM